MRRIRVLLADDHPGLLVAVRDLLKADVDVIGSVGDGESLLEAAIKVQADVIITDISMPKLNGIEAVHRLRESGCSSKVVFLTVHSDPDIVRAAFETTALAYVLKTSITMDLSFAVREVLAGRTFVSPEVSAQYGNA